MENKNVNIELIIDSIMVEKNQASMSVTLKSEDSDTITLTGLLYAMMESMRLTHLDYMGLGPKIDQTQAEILAVKLLRETLRSIDLREPESQPQRGGGKKGRKWSEESKKALSEKRMRDKLKTQVESRNSEERPENQKQV